MRRSVPVFGVGTNRRDHLIAARARAMASAAGMSAARPLSISSTRSWAVATLIEKILAQLPARVDPSFGLVLRSENTEAGGIGPHNRLSWAACRRLCGSPARGRG